MTDIPSLEEIEAKMETAFPEELGAVGLGWLARDDTRGGFAYDVFRLGYMRGLEDGSKAMKQVIYGVLEIKGKSDD